jgi:hypothetical protein
MNDEARKLRDMRLRRRALQVLKTIVGQSPTGELSGRALREEIDAGQPRDQRTENDRHALTLFGELASWGLTIGRDARTRRDQDWGLDHAAYRITGDGLELLAEARPPHPGVDDLRRIED